MADAVARPGCNVCGSRFEGQQNFCGVCGSDLRGMSGANATKISSGPSRALAAGRLIAGRYRVVEPIGEGGIGSVWKVEHAKMGKVMALKVLRGGLAGDRRAVERFAAEARAASRLTSSNTVSIYDFGEDEDGSLYIVMEYVDGRDLALLLEQEGPLPAERAILITAQVLRSLGEAHDLGLVHRDIKPANVVIIAERDGEDFAKVLDFGFATLIKAPRVKSTGPTLSGEIVGTPDYMSPEQIRGGALSPGTDIYAVGAMLFQMITGRPPFLGKNPVEVMTFQVSERPKRPSELRTGAMIPPGLEEAILTALEKDPRDRFPNADSMREALLGCMGSGVRRKVESVMARTPPQAPEPQEDAGTFRFNASNISDDRGLLWEAKLEPPQEFEEQVPDDGPTLTRGSTKPALRAASPTLPVNFCASAGDRVVAAHASNISQVGMFIRTAEPLVEGSRAVVHCFLPGDGTPLEAEVRVLFVVETGGTSEAGMGVEFAGLDFAARERIERAARRRTR